MVCSGTPGERQRSAPRLYTQRRVLKGALLLLANQQPIYRLVMRYDLLRDVAWRYVAGESLADGLRAAQSLNGQGLEVSLDHLGESVADATQARAAAQDYVEALEAIARKGLRANISLKLTQMGLDVAPGLCRDNMRAVLGRARDLGPIFVRIDMESSAYTQRTLDLPVVKKAVKIDYLGFTIEDVFVIGYGLDYAERYRNLPYLGVLELGS